jgi:hypothetical protein
MSARVAVPGAVGMLALLAACYFGYLTLRGGAAPQDRADVTPTHRVASPRGGFSIGVPAGMRVTRRHGTLTLADHRHDLVVTVGRAGAGPLSRATARFVRSLRREYSHLRVLGHQPQRIAGRRALATYGRAINAHHARLRFVTVAVRARPRDYAITAFTAYDSDPSTVLPRVDAIASTFSVLR